MHVFCDASEQWYGVVAYCRFTTLTGNHYCSLSFAKSRVAPLKAVTIPRLELNAARLAVRVASDLNREMLLNFEQTIFWTDSMIVIYYIQNKSACFSTFVSNRLSTIHQLSQMNKWRHVRSEDNPADLVSRGTSSNLTLSKWFKGPAFLEHKEELWLSTAQLDFLPKEVEYKNKKAVVNAINKRMILNDLTDRYSNWMGLLKAFVWITRFKTYLRIMKNNNSYLSLDTGFLKISELQQAELDIVRLVQAEVFGSDISSMQQTCKNKQGFSKLSRISSLRRLNPILENGILRVGGRLNYSCYEYSIRHPIILPKLHHVSELIIRHYHMIEGHCGYAQVLSSIRKKYWIIQGGATIKRLIGSCWICRKHLAQSAQQMMAPLPEVRVQPGWHPFQFVGIDYFGPLSVKLGRRMEKRYGCIFTCLQTRAVHFEVAHSLNTDSFILVLKRFISRRGSPAEIFCDNGSNFVGAEAELRKARKQLTDKRINDEMLARGVQWRFNTPMASHRGGVWERLIRTAKRILTSMSKDQVMTDEGLATFIVEVERIMNSRPIVPVESDVTDLPALTPNDILLLRSHLRTTVPSNTTERYTRGWQQANYMTGVFWKRWTNEYIPTLQLRQKWLMKQRNMQNGDVVLIVDSQLPRYRWPIGVVDSCEVSSDVMVQSVIIRTKEGKLKRDVRKLCLIEGSE